MTERRAGAHAPAEVQEPQAAELLDALVSLVASWSSPVVQGEIATRMGLSINEADVRTLHTIGRFGSLRPAQLAAELYLTRPTTSKSLARLAGAGLIERRSATDDARAADYRELQMLLISDPAGIDLFTVDHTYVARGLDQYTNVEHVVEPHEHGVAWGPWWNVADWR